ncbi:hypothetical protein M0R45_035156 [Rubus argutus]|uniref:Uncharacterized protein n=1 Tax=Rubus argutus TaxID=59490 RepID=A0AAW1VTU2_RUBAR
MDRVLEVFAQDRFIALEVSLQRRHDRGDVGDYEVGEAQKVKSYGGDSAAGAELDGAFGVETEKVGVGVLGWLRGAQRSTNLTRTKEQGQTSNKFLLRSLFDKIK